MKLYKWVILLMIVLFLSNIQKRNRLENSNSTSASESIYKPDTIREYDTVYLPAPPIVEQIPCTIPMTVDTGAILDRYFTKNVYSNKIEAPGIEINIIDTIFQNKLLGRSVTSNYEKVVLRPYRNAITLGCSIAPESKTLMGGYRHKKWEFLGGYDFEHRGPMVAIKYDLIIW